MEILEELGQAVIAGNWDDSPQLTQEALDAGHDAHTILESLVGAMDVVGEEWTVGNMFIPEVLVSAKAMQGGMDVLRPYLTEAETALRGTVVIGTVQGDLHDIGKSLVAMMLEGGGFQVYDLGVDISPAAFVEAVTKYRPQIVGMSALLTTTLPYMRDTIRALEEAGVRESVRVFVGGAPVTPEFAALIGADGYAPDGAGAVAKARELVGAA